MSPFDTMWSETQLSWNLSTAITFLDIVTDWPCFDDRGEIWLQTVSWKQNLIVKDSLYESP